jgi:hypothetical protein
MRKRVSILTGTVLLLTLVLAIPASASKQIEIRFWADTVNTPETNCQEKQIADNCFVKFQLTGTYAGDVQGDWVDTTSILAKGPCDTDYPYCGPGPMYYQQILHFDEVVTGSVLVDDVEHTGTFRMTCEQWVSQDPPRTVENCVIHSGTDGLANLHGIVKWSETEQIMVGQVHFDPK